MIDELRVRCMGGIRAADLRFAGDFIVITGESGAGKSSLVRAFEFISGKRAQTTYIHSACDEASVEAVWDAPAEGTDGAAGEEQLITRRLLSRSGKGRCFIHGALATAGQLAEVSAPLIEIQSQFAQLNLLDSARQLDMVDACGGEGLREVRDALARLFPLMLEAEREILDVRKKRSEIESDLEGAPARVRMIRSLNLTPGCEQEWEDELQSLEKRLGEAGRYDELIYRMRGGDAEVELIDQLDALLRELYAVAPDASRGRWEELGESGLSALQDLFSAVRSELDMIPRDELESLYERAEARIGALRRVKRETGLRTAEDLMHYVREVEADAQWLKESRALLDEKQAKTSALRAEVSALARQLRILRERAAADFESRVNRHLADLAMDDVRFSVVINRLDRVRASGAESAVFLLAQKDLPPNPVSRVASGGELSRILIAIQASIDPERLPGAIVFDEVEAGLGGRTALLAGEKLREISRSCRTILITHEATIAAMADQHFVVRRTGDDTSVEEIRGADREREIARMLSGTESTAAIEHARALLGAR